MHDGNALICLVQDTGNKVSRKCTIQGSSNIVLGTLSGANKLQRPY